ncbi:MAG: acyltransferase [Proteobacteria bacterium]|nr:acyltransferase [Pseudomonadota bacterium]
MDNTNTSVAEIVSQPKPRNSNLELFRILVMLLIVAHHYVTASGLMLPEGPMYSNPFSFNSLWLFLFGAWGKIGINCFVLITGYFMCKSNITLKKFIKLFAQVLFYGVIINALFLCFDPNFSTHDFLSSQLPFLRIKDNFVACFLVFFFFIPFLNILIKNLNEKQHIRLIALCLFTYSVLALRPIFDVSFNYVSWFMILYLVSSYIRLYPKKLFDNTKIWAILLAITAGLSCAAVIGSVWVSAHYHRTIAYAYVADSNQLIAFVTSLCAFMTFKNLKIKTNKFINAVAATTFGVFLFHSYCAPMRRWLWDDVFNNLGAYSHSWLFLHSIFAVVAVFCAGALFDWIRLKWIERPFMKYYDRLEPGILSRCQKIEDKFVHPNNVLENKDVPEQKDEVPEQKEQDEGVKQ